MSKPKDDNYINFDDEEDEKDLIKNIINDNDDIEDDDDNIDIIIDLDDDIIELEEDFINSDDVEDIGDGDSDKFDLMYRFNTNKHKQEGKHRLQRDTIFKGKLDKKDENSDINNTYQDTSNEYGDIVNFLNDYDDADDHLNQNNLTKDVYDILKTKTDLDFKQNRRKPNKETFNEYYSLLLKELGFRYTRSEIFVELSYYFTDNIFNMFKLLDKKPATIIIKELLQKGYLKNLDGINFL